MVRAGRRRRRGAPGRRASPATPRSRRPGTPVHRRIDEEATTDWDDTIAVDRLRAAGATVHHGVGRLAGPGLVEVEAVDGEDAHLRGQPRSRAQPGHPSGRCRRSRGSRTRRTGPTATRCSSPSCRGRWSWSAGARSAASWHRSSPGSAYGSPSCSTVRGWSRATSPRRLRCWRRCSATRASGCSPASSSSGRRTPTARSRSASTPARSWSPTSCWSRPGGRPTSTTSAWKRRTRPGAPARSRSTTGCACRTVCGRSATSPARARSRTSRCTSRRSRCATSSARTVPRPATTPSRTRPSPIPRSAASG